MTEDSSAQRVVRPAKNSRTQVIRSRARWPAGAEERFLGVLGETCNVRAGCRSGRVFDRDALQAAGALTGLRGGVGRGGGAGLCPARGGAGGAGDRQPARRDDRDGEGRGEEGEDRNRAVPFGVGPMTIAQAVQVLRPRYAVRGGPAQNFAWRRAAPDPEAMRTSILRKLEAIERAEARPFAGEHP